MKSILLKFAFAGGLSLCATLAVQAQTQKMGDNLGNHVAKQDLTMSGHAILNASGVAVGTITFTNNSVALQIGDNTKAIVVTNVADNASIVAPVNGMIVYNTTNNKFYLYQNGAWVTFALALTPSTDGIGTTSTANGYTLTQVGQETVLKLTPADATNPGIITTGAQTLAGAKTLTGNLTVDGATLRVASGSTILEGSFTVGTPTAPERTALNGDLGVTGKAVFNGNTGTLAAPSSGLVIQNSVPAQDTPGEKILVIDSASGEVRRASIMTNVVKKQKIAVPSFSLAQNEATTIELTVTDVNENDGIVVNFEAADILANTDLKYIAILNATATAQNKVTVTLADQRQENASGTALVAASTLLAGKSFLVTRYR